MESTASRKGWRYFDCEDCGEFWKETTRDRFSPSGVDCDNCGAWCHPVNRVPDDDLRVDSSGNLLAYQTLVMRHGKECQ